MSSPNASSNGDCQALILGQDMHSARNSRYPINSIRCCPSSAAGQTILVTRTDQTQHVAFESISLASDHAMATLYHSYFYYMYCLDASYPISCPQVMITVCIWRSCRRAVNLFQHMVAHTVMTRVQRYERLPAMSHCVWHVEHNVCVHHSSAVLQKVEC